jgi:hypothetical protein
VLPSTTAPMPRRAAPVLLEAMRLPELYRRVCRHAGLPPAPAADTGERFVLRSGDEPPDLYGKLLEEAFVEDEAEVPVYRPDDPLDYRRLGPGHVAVRPGFDAPCPAVVADLRRAVRPEGGRVMVFTVERRDTEGRLLGVTWAAVPEEEPAPRAEFRAAVLRQDQAAGARGFHAPTPAG